MLCVYICESVHTFTRPHFLHSRRGALDSLRTREADRSAGFVTMLQSFAEEAVRGLEAEGPTLRHRLSHLVGGRGGA